MLAFAALTVAQRGAAQGGSDLDQFNGFQSGGAGDYTAHGAPSGSPFHRVDAAGQYGLETAAASGANEYVQVALSAPTTSLTDGIWACVETAPSGGGARRIRSWLNGSNIVMEMRLVANRQLQIDVNDVNVIPGSAPIALCPDFSAIVVQYTASESGGTVILDVNGAQTSGVHLSADPIDATRIGPDDAVARSVAVVWDDHAVVRDVTFPGALRIAGLLPRPPADPSDPNFRSEWPPSVGCASAVACTDEQPSDGDVTFVATSTPGAMQSFCMQLASTGGIFGNILSVKSLLASRSTAPPASLSLQLRTNAQACGAPPNQAATSDPIAAAIGSSYDAATRIDATVPGTATAWSVTGLNRAATLVSLASGSAARVSQVVREVAFDTFGFPSPTPTVTATPTPTATFTPSATSTRTATFTPSATSSPTPTVTATPTPTPSVSHTPTVSPTPSVSATPTATFTPSATGTITSTRTATSTPSVTSSATLTGTATATHTPTQTPVLRQLAAANGFEAGWAADYAVSPDNTSARIISAPAAPPNSGDFAVELPSSGFARYLTATLPAPSHTFSDGISACFATSLTGSQRIRQWFNTGQPVVELLLLPDGRLELDVSGSAVGVSTTPLSVCPTYTRLEVQYLDLSAGGGMGFAFLRVNGHIEVSANHSSSATVSQTHIGNDTVAPLQFIAALHWDDHTFSSGTVFPGDLAIIGLMPAADGFYGTTWSRQNCPAGPLFPCLQARPPNLSVVIGQNTPLERASFCPADPVAAGVTGPIVGVKMITDVREIPNASSLGGLFVRTGGCADAGGTDQPEVAFDPNVNFIAFSRLDETNPATGSPWSADDITSSEFGIRHPNDDQDLFVSQLLLEVIYDRNPPTPPATPTHTITPTRTRTLTPTLTATPTLTSTSTRTAAPTDTPTATPITPAPTATASATRTATRTATATGIPTPVATDTPLPPASSTITATPTISLTPSVTRTATDTPVGSPPTATRTATASATPTATGPTPTPTNTFPPRADYIFVMGNTNSWDCSANRATSLGLSSVARTLEDLFGREDPVQFHNLYLSLYVAPGLDDEGYGLLQELSAPPSDAHPDGGFIHRFVSLGGLAVINVAPAPTATPSTPKRPNLAPRGVGYQPPLMTEGETINAPQHPLITGQGFGGVPLSGTSFSAWAPTDRGYLTDVPLDATVLLKNARGPTMIEYNHGAGKVIMTTLTFCTPSQPSSIGDALDNLLEYGRFYLGGAQTPALTVTPTLTPTPTATGQATATGTRTRTPLVSATPTETPTPEDSATPTPVACVGDCDGSGTVEINELLLMVNISLGAGEVSSCPAGDVAGGDPSGPDGQITVDELIRAVNNALNNCPAV